MTQHFFIGVDGGATKCIVRVEDETGFLLGQEISGPASIRLSVSKAWQSIYSALDKILQAHDLSLASQDNVFHAGMGIAGCELTTSYQAFLKYPHPFQTLAVTSDAHIACLGAHAGADGGIIIAGTGVVGYQLCKGKTNKVGGWGFPCDDKGGGAWIGLQAIKTTLEWLDRRGHVSKLAEDTFSYFNHDQNRLVDWANQASSTLFAELVPLVVKNAEQGDKVAMTILQRAATAIDQVSAALTLYQREQQVTLPCAFVGGISSFLRPRLSPALSLRLSLPKDSPDRGGIILVRKQVGK